MDLTSELISRTKELQQKMDKILAKLQEEYSYKLGDRLVDDQGYPRSDIDVYLVSKSLAEYKRIRKEWEPLRKELESLILNGFKKEK